MNKKVIIFLIEFTGFMPKSYGACSSGLGNKSTAPFLSEEDQDRNFLSQSLVGQDIRYLTLERLQRLEKAVQKLIVGQLVLDVELANMYFVNQNIIRTAIESKA